MTEGTTASDRPADAFQSAHDRLAELRAILGIEAPESTALAASAAPVVSVQVASEESTAPRGREFDLRNPSDVLLIVLWSSMIGLLTAAILATN